MRRVMIVIVVAVVLLHVGGQGLGFFWGGDDGA